MFPLLNRNVPHVEQKILSYLEPDDLVMAAFVCKRWYLATGTTERHSILLRAVEIGCQHLVTYILDDQQIKINESWPLRTPLYHAVINEQEQMVKLLLGRGNIDVNLNNPLMWAAFTGNMEILQLLLNREDIAINNADVYGTNALMNAAWKGHDKIVKDLLRRQDLDINAKNKAGDNAMMVAVMFGNDEIVKLLLGRKDIDINATTMVGVTSLMLAVREGHLRITQYLLQNPSIDINVKDDFGTAAVTLAPYYWFTKERSKKDYVEKMKVVILFRKRGACVDTWWIH